MPDRYYTERIELASGVYMSMIFIDSSPCVLDYREDNPKYWDPCSTQYPTCSMGSTDDDFEGPCQFHENILGQDCGMQYYWFQTMLAAVPADDWLVVVGHHPIDELDYADFTTLLQNRGFSIYLNGHTHTLNRYTIDNAGIYITSGAGALVDTVDQSHPVTSAKVRGENLKTKLYKSTPSVGAEVKYNSHTYKTIYNNKVAGFTTHTFNEDFTVLTTNFVTYTGDIVYSFTSNKKGQELSSSL